MRRLPDARDRRCLEHGGRIWTERAPAGGARVAFELLGFLPHPAGVVAFPYRTVREKKSRL